MGTLSVADFDYIDDGLIILNGIDDTVWPLPNPVALRSRQFLATRRTRIIGQGLNTSDDSAAIGPARDSF